MVKREDLGLETESLNLAKTIFYIKGIGGQMDSGAWKKLEPAQQLDGFNHLLLWQRSGKILLGRFWSSTDGKGRPLYPMVACLHFVGVTLGWALKQGLPALAELEREAINTSSAVEVCSLLRRKRAALRQVIATSDDRGEYAPLTPEVLHNILQSGVPASPGEGNGPPLDTSHSPLPTPDAFLRVLYQIQNQFGMYAPGNFNSRANLSAMRAQQIRLPAAAADPEQTLLFWTRFLLTQIAPSVPLLTLLPLQADWLDVTAGEPDSHEFFCLRASAKVLPRVSEIPYTLDDTFRARATAFLDRFRQGETAPSASGDGEPASAKSGWRKWLGLAR